MRIKILGAIVSGLGAILALYLWLFQGNLVVAAKDTAVYEQAQKLQPEFLATLETLVNIDSGTGEGQGIAQVEDLVIEQLKAVGAEVKTIDAKPSVGRNILATLPGTGQRQILLLAHTDTVFPAGTAAQRPFKIVGGKAYGPGVMDDKGGILLGIEALKILKALKFQDFGTITFLINPDEEKGSFGSRELIKATAKQHDVALVLEFGSPADKVTSWRKGIGYYGFEVKGRAAHAGAEPEKGCNALLEAAHQTVQMRNLGDRHKQTSINFTVFQAGDRPNTIPDRAKVQADVRVLEAQEYVRLERDLERLAKNRLLPCTQIEIVAERGRPPFPPNPQTEALVKKAQAIYQTIGLQLGVEGSGGGTDGNYTAAAGTATLDALGPVGGGAHSPDEYIDLERIGPRIYLLTKLLMDLSASR